MYSLYLSNIFYIKYIRLRQYFISIKCDLSLFIYYFISIGKVNSFDIIDHYTFIDKWSTILSEYINLQKKHKQQIINK